MEPPLLQPPVSKSDAHRALVLASICNQRVKVPKELPRDVEVLSAGLATLETHGARIDCLDAGAPFRFLLTQAALVRNGNIEFTGTTRLAERPHGPLILALERSLDVRIVPHPVAWPLKVEVRSDRFDGAFRIEGAESSQFASSLLLGAAKLVHDGHSPVSVTIEGPLASAGYLELTVHWLRAFGFTVDARSGSFTVGHFAAVASPPSIPGDWSSLTVLLPLAWKYGCAVEGAELDALHPDRRFATCLEDAGLSLVGTAQRLEVKGVLRRGLSVDASRCPDSMPALVALALVAPERSVFTHCNVLRLKESDRLDALAELVRLMGGQAEVANETLTVTPSSRTSGAVVFDARDDHRLVMAAVVAGALLERAVSVRGTRAVVKSFPSFWREVGKLGLTAQEAG